MSSYLMPPKLGRKFTTGASGASRFAQPYRQTVSFPLLTSGLPPSETIGKLFARNSSAYVTDHDGIDRFTNFHEIRFKGARRVENCLYTDTEYFTGTGWVANGSATKTPNGDGTCTVVFGDTAGSGVYCLGNTNKFTIGDTHCISVWLRAVSTPGNVLIQDPVGTLLGPSSSLQVAVTTEWKRYAFIQTITSGTGTSIGCWIRRANTDPTDVIFKMPQVERITLASVQAPGEYVSVGVGTGGEMYESGARTFESGTYNWVKGATHTMTNENNTLRVDVATGGGSPILRNDFLESQDLNTYMRANSVYHFSARLKVSFGGGRTLQPQIYDGSAGLNFVIPTTMIGDTGGNWITIRQTFRYTGSSTAYFRMYGDRQAGDVFWLDDISLKLVDHGANVDGVKYFDTANGNTVDGVTYEVTEAAGAPLATLKGIHSEGARTNRVKESQTLATTPWASSCTGAATCTPTNNDSFSPTGTKTATKLAFSASADGEYSIWRQLVTGITNPSAIAVSIWLKTDADTTVYLRNASGLLYACSVTTTWQRFIVPTFNLAATTFNFDIGMKSSTGGTSLATNIWAWGAQLESGGSLTAYHASTYIPTTNAIGGRQGDNLQYDMTGSTNRYKPNIRNGAVYCELIPDAADAGVNQDCVGDSNATSYYFRIGTSTKQFFSYDGTNPAATCATLAVAGTTFKCLSRWNSTGIQVTVNGDTGTKQTFDNTMGYTYVNVGYAGTRPYYGTIRNLRFYVTFPSDAFVAGLMA